jgi:transposase
MKCIGIDLGSRTSMVTILSGTKKKEKVERHEVETSRKAMRLYFGALPKARVLMEVCTESPWVSRLLKEAGHEVIVCNAHRLRLIAETSLKTDELDSETLARLARFVEVDDNVFHRVEHRSEETQMKRAVLTVRNGLVASRTRVTNLARGLARSVGHPLPSCKVDVLPERIKDSAVAASVKELVSPLLRAAEELTHLIEEQEEKLKDMASEHEAVARLMTVPGVGLLTGLQFVLTVEDPARFPKSRDVGPYLGLRPRVRNSSSITRSGHITKEGDAEMRRLLIQASHTLLICGQDNRLKRWGLGLMKDKGRKKAVVAVARKLAVILHRIWVSGGEYEAWPGGSAPPAKQAA